MEDYSHPQNEIVTPLFSPSSEQLYHCSLTSELLYHRPPSSELLYHCSPTSQLLYHCAPTSELLFHCPPASELLYHCSPTSQLPYHCSPTSELLYHCSPTSELHNCRQFRGSASSQLYISGGVYRGGGKFSLILQLRPLATFVPSLGRVGQCTWELGLPNSRKCHFLSDPCVFGYIY